MKQWFWSYGWKFVLALIVFGLLLAYLVQLERKASGEAGVRSPAAPALHAVVLASPASVPSRAPASRYA
ncbi:MAG: hypothetical protein JWO02_3642 [Solirubrobacterales bacterium]|nr:hypothetical protein [Solirubrobacterales bacterium]